MKPPFSLNIIGCGAVGRTLGFLWQQQHYFEIQDLCSRSLDSAVATQQFIGSGSVCKSLAELTRANVYLISTSDDQIESTAKTLADSGIIDKGDIAFHCSGALSSDVLLPLQNQGALIASTHPIKSFVDAESASKTFTGTYCTLEGEEKVLGILGAAFEQIGAHTLPIDKEHKALYHSSTTIICNYLCTLMEVGLNCLEKSGFDRAQAQKAVEPLAMETLGNIFTKGPAEALTGPIARGDTKTVKRQLDAIKTLSAEHLPLFELLSKETLRLAADKAPDAKLADIGDLFQDNKN